MEQTITNIKEYLQIINPSITIAGNNLLDFVILEVLDRVQLYLNRTDIPTNLNRILANIINNSLTKANKSISNNGDVEQVITSISDNGQSISYSNEIRKYFVNADDDDLFSGFTNLLSRYRRVKVVHPTNNER